MDAERSAQWSRIEIDASLAGRRAGASASGRAAELRTAAPIRTRLDRILRRRSDERAWRRGANGERITGFWLGRLPDGWYAFHDIPVGKRGANIDHVVVGPAGVFTINTKNLTGTVRIARRTLKRNGHPTDFLPKAANEAQRASRLLTRVVGSEVVARGVLAILADRCEITEQPSDIHVGSPREVRNWMLAQPGVLTSSQVINLASAINRPATWRDSVSAGAECSCGGTVVARIRKRDGEPFLGCSNFPRCRRTCASADD
jgi:hypothetical protein